MHGKDTNYKKEIADQSRKYVYKENKKLEKGRYGFLDNIIDIFLNNKTSKKLNIINENFNYFVRYGIGNIKENSFLESILILYNINYDNNNNNNNNNNKNNIKYK